MKTLTTLILALAMTALPSFAVIHTVALLPSNAFAPDDITVAQGDTIRWTNTGDFHNVREASATPLFRSGDPIDGFWIYDFDSHGAPVGTYDYICEVHAPEMSGTVTIEIGSGTCDDLCRPATVVNFGVLSSYPNPFNPATTIAFDVEHEGHVKLAVFDRLGREVAVLTDRSFSSGAYEVPFNGAGLPSGVYFARLETSAQITTTKLLLLK